MSNEGFSCSYKVALTYIKLGFSSSFLQNWRMQIGYRGKVFASPFSLGKLRPANRCYFPSPQIVNSNECTESYAGRLRYRAISRRPARRASRFRRHALRNPPGTWPSPAFELHCDAPATGAFASPPKAGKNWTRFAVAKGAVRGRSTGPERQKAAELPDRQHLDTNITTCFLTPRRER